ncbi:MAG TPA: type II toxin-antitoxin system HicA family toxin [Candidatus Binatia bacterium]|nr:type II toxin-antitoxin system HicA family toxin [Candidatus Binatia bacterium]
MKRGDLLRHLRQNGCELLREGARHSWWYNPRQNKRSSVPRHNEITDLLVRKICKDLGIPPIK